MPQDAEIFVKTLRKNAFKELETTHFADQTGALLSSLHTVSSLSAGVIFFLFFQHYNII